MDIQKTNVCLEVSFKINIKEEQDIQVLFQKEAIPDTYAISFVEGFEKDDKGLFDLEEVSEVAKKGCMAHLENIRVLALLEGVEYNIELQSLSSHFIH